MPELDDITIGYYQIAASNIANAYIPYYRNISTYYSDTKGGVGKIAEEQQLRMSKVLGLLGRAMGRGVTPITRKELEELNELLGKIKEVHKQVSVLVKESTLISKDSEKAVKDLNIPLKDIKATSDAVTNKRKVVRRAAGYALRHPFWGALLGGLGWKGATVGRGAIGAALGLLGPLAPLAGPVLGAAGVLGYGLYKTPKMLGAAWRGMFGRNEMQPPGIAPGEAIPPIAGLGVPSAPGITKPFRALSRRQKEMATEPLFYFFNKRAYRAGWTRDVLAALTGRRVGGMGGAISSFRDWLKVGAGAAIGAGLIKYLGAVGAVTITAGTAYFAGNLIYKKYEKPILSWFEKLFEAWYRYPYGEPEKKTLIQEVADVIKDPKRGAKKVGGLLETIIRPTMERKGTLKPRESIWDWFKRTQKIIPFYGTIDEWRRTGKGLITITPRTRPAILPPTEAELMGIPTPEMREGMSEDAKIYWDEMNKRLDKINESIQSQLQQAAPSIPAPRGGMGLPSDNEDPLLTLLSLGYPASLAFGSY